MDNLLYVITDGGRARLVERNAAGGFSTVAELDHRAQLSALRDELRASPPPRSFEGRGGSRHTVGLEGEAYLDQSKAAFVAQVAETVARRAIRPIARRCGGRAGQAAQTTAREDRGAGKRRRDDLQGPDEDAGPRARPLAGAS